ncbi:MAG: FAD-dependent thymidylate synthase [Trueperaceae bacterium]
MARIAVPAAEALLDAEVPVLDHGFVRLVDYLGGDDRIVQAARVSYGAGTRTVREDAALIDYLLRHAHTSPFEQVVLTYHLKMPIFVARQWMRHRTARANEISGRYSVLPGDFYLPDADQLRPQSTANKQGRAEHAVPPEQAERVLALLRAGQVDGYAEYETLIEDGLARELARLHLPLSLYTEMYWQIDLHNLMHFLRLRLDAHAQYEIRAFARALAQGARAVAPVAYDAFEEHVLHAHRLSRSEMELVREALDEDRLRAALAASGLRRTRRRELLQKLGWDEERTPDDGRARAGAPDGEAAPDGAAGADGGPSPTGGEGR